MLRNYFNLKSSFYGDENDPYYEKFLATLPFAQSHIIIPYISVFYIFSIIILKKIMKNVKKPINILAVIKFYNLIQVIANIFIIYIGLSDGDFLKNIITNLTGENVPNYKLKTKLIFLSYLWCILKVSDLFDTIFFILRKKDSHVTFLHVYHHSTTMILAYVVFRYFHIEQIAVAAAVNSTIHVFMYSYYFLTSIGLRPKWKKTVTTMQIVQFFTIAIGNLILFFFQKDSRYYWFSIYIVAQCVMYIFLFMKFYKKTYSKINNTKED